MLRIPIKQDKTVKVQLALEDAIHELAVFAAVGVVDAVVGAHHRGDSSVNTVHEWPQIEFMQRFVVYIGRSSFNTKIRSAIRLLLVGNEVLGVSVSSSPAKIPFPLTPYLDVSNHTGILNADDSLGIKLT